VEKVDAGEPVNNQDENDFDDTDDDASGTSGSDTATDQEQTPDEDDNKGFLRRTVTGLTALGLGLGWGMSPAQATQAPQDDDISDQVEDDSVEDDVDPQAPETFPVVVDAQFERILNAVAASVAKGDDEHDADA